MLASPSVVITGFASSDVNAGFLSPPPPSGHLPPQAGEGIFRAKRRKCWPRQAASLLASPSGVNAGFSSPLPPSGHLPPQAGKGSFVPSGVNIGLAKRRRYWVRFKRRKCWIFIPPSALREPSPASGEGIFRAKRRKYRLFKLRKYRIFIHFPPSGHLPPQAGGRNIVPSGVNAGLFKRRKCWIFIPPSALRAPSPASGGGRNISSQAA